MKKLFTVDRRATCPKPRIYARQLAARWVAGAVVTVPLAVYAVHPRRKAIWFGMLVYAELLKCSDLAAEGFMEAMKPGVKL